MASSAGVRFSEITPHDHQAWLWNLSLMSLAFSFLTLGMRIIVKLRMYGVDDLALAIAYVSDTRICWAALQAPRSAGAMSD